MSTVTHMPACGGIAWEERARSADLVIGNMGIFSMNQKERMLAGLPYKAWLDGLEEYGE